MAIGRLILNLGATVGALYAANKCSDVYKNDYDTNYALIWDTTLCATSMVFTVGSVAALYFSDNVDAS